MTPDQDGFRFLIGKSTVTIEAMDSMDCQFIYNTLFDNSRIKLNHGRSSDLLTDRPLGRPFFLFV